MANKNIDGRTLWNPLSGIIKACGANGTGGAAGDLNKLSVAITAGQTLLWVIKVFMTDNISIQLNWTGTLKGVWTLGTCLDYCEFENGANQTPGTWTDITANGTTKYPGVTKMGTDPSGSNTGPVLFNVWNIAEPFLELTYTADASAPGSGTITGWQNGKGL
jgi:hypothetical protein